MDGRWRHWHSCNNNPMSLQVLREAQVGEGRVLGLFVKKATFYELSQGLIWPLTQVYSINGEFGW